MNKKTKTEQQADESSSQTVTVTVYHVLKSSDRPVSSHIHVILEL